MQVRRNPITPGMKGRNRPTRTMTTHSTPIPQQCIPPRLSKATLLNPLKHIRHRLEAPTKEEDCSKRGVHKILSTMHINLIPLSSPIQPTSTAPPNSSASKTSSSTNTWHTSHQKGRAASSSGTTRITIRIKKASLSTLAPNIPDIIYTRPSNGISNCQHNIRWDNINLLPMLYTREHVLEATGPDAPHLLSALQSDSDSQSNENAQQSDSLGLNEIFFSNLFKTLFV